MRENMRAKTKLGRRVKKLIKAGNLVPDSVSALTVSMHIFNSRDVAPLL